MNKKTIQILLILLVASACPLSRAASLCDAVGHLADATLDVNRLSEYLRDDEYSDKKIEIYYPPVAHLPTGIESRRDCELTRFLDGSGVLKSADLVCQYKFTETNSVAKERAFAYHRVLSDCAKKYFEKNNIALKLESNLSVAGETKSKQRVLFNTGLKLSAGEQGQVPQKILLKISTYQRKE